MLNAAELERLNLLSLQLEEIYKPIRIEEYNTPLNRREEKERLYSSYSAGKPYNPQFAYQPFAKDMKNPLQRFIREIHPERNPWETLLYNDAKQMLDTLETVFTHDPAQITAFSIAADGLPSKELVEQAYEEIAQTEALPEEETLTAEEASGIIRESLNSVGLSDWKIIIDETMNAGMMVRSIEKQVKIRKGKRFSEHSIKRLLVHEIGTHVFRYTNGAIQKVHLLRLGLSGYMMTEEGMATFHEKKYHLRDLATARRYALRTIAAHMSLTHSYYDVFAYIVGYTDFDDAFDIVTRSKRGFIDTSQYGAHVKDKVYFEGFGRVSQHLQQYTDDYVLLMSGKVSLAMLPLLKELQSLNLFVSPPYLPELLKLPS